MKFRRTSARVTLLAAPALALVALGLSAPAEAITNPAANPRPITVKGDDGKTYTDGADTLPGFDDEDCTYIPGAWFDFDNNRVRYADGQSIPWTEWERATGYKKWLDSKNAGSNPGSGSSNPGSGSGSNGSSNSGGGSTGGSKGNSGSKGGTSKDPKGSTSNKGSKPSGSQGSGKSNGSTTTPSTTATDPATEPTAGATEPTTSATDAANAPGDKAEKNNKKDKAGQEATEAVTPQDETTTDAEATAEEPSTDTVEPTAASSDGGSANAGVLVLGGLVVAAGAVLGGWTIRNRRRAGA